MLVFTAGTKGGVGKSFASIMLASAALDLNLPIQVYDTDNENNTISVLLKENVVQIDELSDTYPLDQVINSFLASEQNSISIVDMKAGTSRTTQEWFSSVPWEAIDSGKIEIYVVGCITSDPESVRTFVPWLNYFRKIDFPVQYILIKNAKDGNSFHTCSTLLEPALQSLNLPYVSFDFQAIEQEYINALNNHGLTLRAHKLNNDSGVLTT